MSWIAIDWGTSSLRAWHLSPEGEVLEQARSGEGMTGLDPSAFEPVLLSLIEPWLKADRKAHVVACGMVGARQGWLEAPYLNVPCAPPGGEEAVSVPCSDTRLDVRILPGLAQREPPDVMRGEETQIAGFLVEQPQFAGTLCLPGTHTKWARVQDGRILGFQTAMTGEVFGLLADASVLRHSLKDGWDGPAFIDAVSESYAAPERLAHSLFAIRARSLLQSSDPAPARARLSGLRWCLSLKFLPDAFCTDHAGRASEPARRSVHKSNLHRARCR